MHVQRSANVQDVEKQEQKDAALIKMVLYAIFAKGPCNVNCIVDYDFAETDFAEDDECDDDDDGGRSVQSRTCN